MKRQWMAILALSSLTTVGFAAEVGTAPSAYFRADVGYDFFSKPSAKTASNAGNSIEIDGTNQKVSDSFGYTIGLGNKVSPEFRTDLTLTYRPSVPYRMTDDTPFTAKGKLDNYTLMLNGYYDINLSNSAVTPYLMAGIGVSRSETKKLNWASSIEEKGKTVNQFAWQAGAGVTFALSDRCSFDLGYRYVDLNTFKNSGSYSNGDGVASSWGKLYSHQVQVGIRYYF